MSKTNERLLVVFLTVGTFAVLYLMLASCVAPDGSRYSPDAWVVAESRDLLDPPPSAERGEIAVAIADLPLAVRDEAAAKFPGETSLVWTQRKSLEDDADPLIPITPPEDGAGETDWIGGIGSTVGAIPGLEI